MPLKWCFMHRNAPKFARVVARVNRRTGGSDTGAEADKRRNPCKSRVARVVPPPPFLSNEAARRRRVHCCPFRVGSKNDTLADGTGKRWALSLNNTRGKRAARKTEALGSQGVSKGRTIFASHARTHLKGLLNRTTGRHREKIPYRPAVARPIFVHARDVAHVAHVFFTSPIYYSIHSVSLFFLILQKPMQPSKPNARLMQDG